MTTETIEFTIPKSEIPSCYGHSIFSPIYQLKDSSWRFNASKTDLFRIFLNNINIGPTKYFKCTVQSSVFNRVLMRTGNFRKGFSTEPVLVVDERQLETLEQIVIICHIQRNTSHIEATETISRKYISCAVQTEDTNNVTEIENPKDEECSSIDIKDDTLFRERMKELLTKGIEHDVTICVKDKQYRAHRSILSTRSPVFAMMLSHDSKEKNTGVIEIEDCDPESFYEFLLYVYSGRTENLTPGNALQLYYSADKYDFPVLKERCVKILKNSLSVESICDVVLLAAKHMEKELLQVATEFFAQNMKKILVTVSWLKFMSQNSVAANELLIKSMEIKNPEN